MKFWQLLLCILITRAATPNFSDSEDPGENHQQQLLYHTLHEKVKSKSHERRCPSLACNTLIANHQVGVPSRLCRGPNELNEETGEALNGTSQSSKRRQPVNKNKLSK